MAQVAVETLVREVMQIARECPMPTLVAAYVRAARLLCDKSHWLVRRVTGETVADTQVYQLVLGAADEPYHEVVGINQMSLAENATRTNVLTESHSGGWDPNASESPPGVPHAYQFLPGGYVALHRTPDGAYPFVAAVPVQPKRDVVTLDSALVNTWDYALEAGALAYLLKLPRVPWHDKHEAKVQEDKFQGYMNQALSSAARGFNAGAQTTDAYGQVSGGLHTRILPI